MTEPTIKLDELCIDTTDAHTVLDSAVGHALEDLEILAHAIRDVETRWLPSGVTAHGYMLRALDRLRAARRASDAMRGAEGKGAADDAA